MRNLCAETRAESCVQGVRQILKAYYMYSRRKARLRGVRCVPKGMHRRRREEKTHVTTRLVEGATEREYIGASYIPTRNTKRWKKVEVMTNGKHVLGM